MNNQKKQEFHEKLSTLLALLDKGQFYCEKNNLSLKSYLGIEKHASWKALGTAIQCHLADYSPELLIEPESLGKGAFIKAVLKLIKELNEEGDPFHIMGGEIDASTYHLDIGVLNDKLNALTPQTPLGKKFLELLQKNSLKCTDVGLVKKVVDAILNKFNDRSYLVKHYDKYKAIYGLKENMINEENLLESVEIYASSLKADVAIFQENLHNCVATAINDLRYKPNRDREKKEEEKEEEQRYKFKTAYANWRASQSEICSGIISHDTKTDSICSMSKAAFFSALIEASKNWEQSQPQLANELRVKIMASLDKESQVKDFVSAMSHGLLSISTSEELIYQNWKKSQIMPSFDDLKTAIITSVDGTSPYNFIGEYVEWAASVSAAVDCLNLSPNQQFVMDKLLDEFKGLFSNKELSFFYGTFEQKMQQLSTEFPALSEVSQVWQATLYEVAVKSNAIKSHYDNLSFSEKQGIEQLSGTLTTIANIETVKKHFIACKRPVVTTKVLLAKGEPVNLTIKLKDGTVLMNTIHTKMEAVNKLVFVAPTGVSLSAANKNGYQFSTKDFFVQSPVFHDKEGVTCYFEFKITYSKNKGSVTSGTERGNEYSMETGSEKSKTDVDIDVTNNTWGVEGEIVPGWLTKPVSLLLGGQLSGSYSHEDGQEVGTEETEGTFSTIGYLRSNTSISQTTKNKGVHTGFMLVKGHVYAHNQNEEVIHVDVFVDENNGITSPASREPLSVEVETTENEVMRWKR